MDKDSKDGASTDGNEDGPEKHQNSKENKQSAEESEEPPPTTVTSQGLISLKDDQQSNFTKAKQQQQKSTNKVVTAPSKAKMKGLQFDSSTPTALLAPSDFKVYLARGQDEKRSAITTAKKPGLAVPSDVPTLLIAPSDYKNLYSNPMAKKTRSKTKATLQVPSEAPTALIGPKDYCGYFYGRRSKEKINQVQSTVPTSIIQLIQQANEPKKKRKTSTPRMKLQKRSSPKQASKQQKIKSRKPETNSAARAVQNMPSKVKIKPMQSITPRSIGEPMQHGEDPKQKQPQPQSQQRAQSKERQTVFLSTPRQSLISTGPSGDTSPSPSTASAATMFSPSTADNTGLNDQSPVELQHEEAFQEPQVQPPKKKKKRKKKQKKICCCCC